MDPVLYAVDPLSGLMVLRGYDRPGALRLALNYLISTPSVFPAKVEFTPASVDMAWVRSAGPFGGILLRFTVSNRESLRSLCNEANLMSLQKALNEGARGQQPVEVIVSPATYRWDSHPLVTYRAYTRKGNASTRDFGREFREFLAILTSDPDIDIANYDRMLKGPNSYIENWRFFDLAGRGKRWLKQAVERANELSRSQSSTTVTERSRFDFQDSTYLAIQDREGERLKKGETYLYVCVGTADKPGVFSGVDHYLRAAPGTDGTPVARDIIRSACRAIGGQALGIFVIKGEVGDRAAIERGLMDLVRGGVELFPRAVQKSASRRPPPRAVAGPYVKVFDSDVAPYSIAQKERRGALGVRFDSKVNRAGLLHKVINVADSVRNAEASVSHLGARTRPLHEPTRSSFNVEFSCTISWTLRRDASKRFREAIDRVISPLCPADRPPDYYVA